MSAGDKAQKQMKMAKRKNTDHYDRLLKKEEILMQSLSPVENYIMVFQSILVWEKPPQSFALFVIVHLLFWLAVTLRVYYILGMTGALLVVIDMWKNHIWPEIRLPPSPGDCMDDWTPIHPRLLSVPEICQYIAPWWLRTEDTISAAISLRKNNHPKFFVLSMLILCAIGVLGLHIRFITLAYFSVLFMLLWPCFLYHNGWHLAEKYLRPAISNLETSFRIRRTRSKSAKRGKRKRGEATPPPLPSDASDSDSEELQQFIPESPPSDPKMAAISTATDSEEDDDENGASLDLLTPPPGVMSRSTSRSPSRELSDLEESSSIGESLTLGLSHMPSYDDTLDAALHSDPTTTDDDSPDHGTNVASDEIMLGRQESMDLEREIAGATGSRDVTPESAEDKLTPEELSDSDSPPKDEMTFVTGHFGPEEEGLDFSSEDVADGSGLMSGVLPKDAIARGQSLITRVAESVVASQLAAGLANIRETVTGAVATTAADQDEALEFDSKQLEAEFEFLGEEDLTDDDKTD